MARIPGLTNVMPILLDELPYRRVQKIVGHSTKLSELDPAYDARLNPHPLGGHRDGAVYFVYRGYIDDRHTFVNDLQVKVTIAKCNIFHSVEIPKDSFVHFQDTNFPPGWHPVHKRQTAFEIKRYHSPTFALHPGLPDESTTLIVYVAVPMSSHSAIYINRTGYRVKLLLVQHVATEKFNQ